MICGYSILKNTSGYKSNSDRMIASRRLAADSRTHRTYGETRVLINVILLTDFFQSWRVSCYMVRIALLYRPACLVTERFRGGGYTKTYAQGKRPVGVALEDTWFLK